MCRTCKNIKYNVRGNIYIYFLVVADNVIQNYLITIHHTVYDLIYCKIIWKVCKMKSLDNPWWKSYKPSKVH